MNQEEEKNNKRTKLDDFIKRASPEYRRDVINAWKALMLEFKNTNHYLWGVQKTFEDMASHSDADYRNLKERNFYRKLEDIKRGTKSGTKDSDMEVFELIESFVKRHKPSMINRLNIIDDLISLNNIAKSFWPIKNMEIIKKESNGFFSRMDIGKNSMQRENIDNKEKFLKPIDENVSYVFDNLAFRVVSSVTSPTKTPEKFKSPKYDAKNFLAIKEIYQGVYACIAFKEKTRLIFTMEYQ